MKPNLIITILLGVLINSSCSNKATITITGLIDSSSGTTVKLESYHPKTFYDSTLIHNGRFKFSITLPEEGFYHVSFNTPSKDYGIISRYLLIYAENGQSYHISAKGLNTIYANDSIRSTSYHQHKLNEYQHMANTERDKLLHKKKYFLTEADKALNAANNKLYSAYLDSVSQVDNDITNVYLFARHRFIRNNPNTIVTPFLISDVPDMFENYQLYKKALDGLSPDIKKSKYYKESAALLSAVSKINIGTRAPLPVGSQPDGTELRLNYRGKKIILLDFWASYCIPCREQVPQLKQLYQKYRQKGFEIVSISIDEDKAKWKRALTQDAPTWPNIAECVDQANSKNIRNFVIKVIPANYILNSKGELIARDVDMATLETMLKKL
ncbi:hypothetical protein CKK33_04840 [Mucilaginibacter sp. MD40]|uniref:TlpA disulfide reductase family protein n=1 Tax=Mucilaginibacter sp. MD40 TaxID=2029590 RepID=UPI000BACDBB7|nr:TlpA disulfide reductase family protein [Mucilaginibacter sp. MD40]PAW92854.1 hypothetical protein CKK33_04840 [Mucilaginibacter sp. MD40]